MTFEQYKTVINTYLDFYPDDRIDLQFDSDILQEALDKDAEGKEIDAKVLADINAYHYSILDIVIYYPIITLTNDAGHHHTIKDVYLSISFPNIVINMGRTTYAQNEVNVGYRHSHIPKGNFCSLNHFCTGYTDTPINKIKRRIIDNKSLDFETDIQSLIIETERMIKIESNEGVPYITFDSINKNTAFHPIFIKWDKTVNLRGCSERQHKLIVDFVKYYCSLGLDTFYYDGRNWQLNASDTEFIDRVTKVAKAYKKTRNAKIYEQVWMINDLYYEQTDRYIGYKLMLPARADWMFKGKHPEMKIENDNDFNEAKAEPKIIVRQYYISILYTFLLNLTNGVYANYDKYKDTIHSRAYKIKTALIKVL